MCGWEKHAGRFHNKSLMKSCWVTVQQFGPTYTTVASWNPLQEGTFSGILGKFQHQHFLHLCEILTGINEEWVFLCTQAFCFDASKSGACRKMTRPANYSLDRLKRRRRSPHSRRKRRSERESTSSLTGSSRKTCFFLLLLSTLFLDLDTDPAASALEIFPQG